MAREFRFDENVSEKQLNFQSTSLIIPSITRTRIHNSMYYKANLDTASLRGNSMLQLSKTMLHELGTCRGIQSQKGIVCGGVEFKCLLMKLIHIRPTWAQLLVILQKGHEKHSRFDNKYLVVLVLTYLRLQYYFLSKPSEVLNITSIRDFDKDQDVTAENLKSLLLLYIRDYRKVKCMALDADCWSQGGLQKVEIRHIDEIVDWLCTESQIWALPLGQCQWCDIYAENEDEDDSDSETESSESESDDDG
ncbi:LAFA_0F04544g1_1 [Lachancea sp. 'fantastica']|nr:LAFA_0F04544g1_1 [Lachancea sp. 'fantastica']